MLTSEQKSVSCMKELMPKFSIPGSLVFNTFARTLSTVKACRLLDKYWQFIKCKKDSGSVGSSMDGLVKVQACQLLKATSDLEDWKKMMEAAWCSSVV